MNRRYLTVAFAALLTMALAQPSTADAQFGKLKDKIKQKVNEKVDKKVDCVLGEVFKDGKCVKAPAGSSEANAAEKAAGGTAAADNKPGKPGQGAWANYDFVPGEKVLYFTDFSDEQVGNFPRRMELEEGNFEVVEWEGRRWLRKEASSDGTFAIPLPDVLPAKWTMEFEANVTWNGVDIFPADKPESYSGSHNRITLAGFRVGIMKGNGGGESVVKPYEVFPGREWDIQPSRTSDRTYKFRVAVDGDYTKVYMEEKRVANVPNAKLTRANKIIFKASIGEWLITNVSINAGGKTMYDALTATGRLAIQGIYFDTGKDVVRAESSGTLKQIADMLKEHADLKLTIEGHTDNVGGAAANKTLSENRAAAVKAALVSSYGIDESRLASVGMGDTKPVEKNDTAEGRQKNRRVELVVQK